MGHGLFWGVFLILVGLALIIKFVFDLDIPVLRIALALFLIMLGIRMLIQDRWEFNFNHNEQDVIFRDATIRGKDITVSEYNVIFGQALFDLTDLDSLTLPKTLKINTLFGVTRIFLKEDLPLLISGSAVFSDAKLAADNSTSFGELSFRSQTYKPDSNHLDLELTVVFGSFELKSKR